MKSTTTNNPKRQPRRLFVAGAGNIGSSLMPQLARLPGVDQVTIIDRDVYEPRNLSQQDILPGDVGLPKAMVQARRLRRINPYIRVFALRADLHDLPLGMFRANVILLCLDSAEARRVASQAAWRLGVPVVDAGINAEAGLYARVTVYVPGADAACLECGWDAATYARLEHSQPCQPDAPKAAPTNAPSSLGAMAAAVQAIECLKLLEGDTEHSLLGRQVMMDALHHTHRVTSFRRNPQCRFDHGVWQVHGLGRGPGKITFGQVRGAAGLIAKSGAWARVEGRPFVKRLLCPCCGRGKATLGLLGRLSGRQTLCRRCGKAMVPVGFEMADRLDFAAMDKELLARPLSRLGFRRHDVFTIGSADGGEIHYEIGRD